MSQPRVLLGLVDADGHELEELAGHVYNGLFQSQLYPSPPVIEEVLQQALATFTTAIAAQKEGGSLATANKQKARLALIGLLRQLAAYVTSVLLAHPEYGLAA